MPQANTIGIIGTGHYLPDTIVTNQEFVSRGLDTSDEWIQTRSGISSRHITKTNQPTSDLATKAAQQAISNSPITLNDIDFIIVATATGDHVGFPSTACLVQQKLNINKPIPCFDISAACSGFTYALSVGYSRILANMGKYGLIIGAESLSNIVDWSDRRSCILFGDGAGAAIIGPVESGGFKGFHEGADGNFADILRVDMQSDTQDFNQTNHPQPRPILHMDGRAVFKKAVQSVEESLTTLLTNSNTDIHSIDYVVAHQANIRILELVASKLNIPITKFLNNIDHVGNTSAASIPLILSEQQSTFKKGDIICLLGFGAGFTWSSILMEWS